MAPTVSTMTLTLTPRRAAATSASAEPGAGRATEKIVGLELDPLAGAVDRADHRVADLVAVLEHLVAATPEKRRVHQAREVSGKLRLADRVRAAYVNRPRILSQEQHRGNDEDDDQNDDRPFATAQPVANGGRPRTLRSKVIAEGHRGVEARTFRSAR